MSSSGKKAKAELLQKVKVDDEQIISKLFWCNQELNQTILMYYFRLCMV